MLNKQMIKKQNTKKIWFSKLACGITLSLFSSTILHAEVSHLQINALVLQAIKTHPLVNAAKADRNATVEGVKAAKLNLLPIPSISSNYDKDEDGFVTSASIQQPLWTGGELTATINQAIFDDKAAIETVYEQQNTVAKNTIEAWQTYITAVGMKTVYANNLNQLDEFEAMMKRRVKQGVSARIDLELIKNRILQEQNNLQGANEQQRIAAARIQQMIGQNFTNDSSINPTVLGNMVKQAKQDATNFESLAFSDISFHNPSVVKAGYQIESAKEEVKSKKAALYPDIYAKYDYTYDHKDGTDDNQFSVGLAYNPGAGFSNFALAKASESRVNSLIQSQEASRRTVIEGIQTQYQQFASTVDQERSLVSAISGTQIVVDSYRRQFKAGRKSWLDVLNAIRELGSYKTELVKARTEMLGAYHKLQVDFGLMPWQQFYQNRVPTERFKPLKQVGEVFSNVADDKVFEYSSDEKMQPFQFPTVDKLSTTKDIVDTKAVVNDNNLKSAVIDEPHAIAVDEDNFEKQPAKVKGLSDTAMPFKPNQQAITFKQVNHTAHAKKTDTNNRKPDVEFEKESISVKDKPSSTNPKESTNFPYGAGVMPFVPETNNQSDDANVSATAKKTEKQLKKVVPEPNESELYTAKQNNILLWISNL